MREEVDLLCERMQLPELALVLDEEAVVQGGSRSEEKAHGIERDLKYKIDRLIQACQSLFVKFLPFCIYFFVASQIMDSRGGSQHLVEDLLRAAVPRNFNGQSDEAQEGAERPSAHSSAFC